MRKTSTIQRLRDMGFDLSRYDGNRQWTPRCSQCQVLVINGMATHELGCPNHPRRNGVR